MGIKLVIVQSHEAAPCQMAPYEAAVCDAIVQAVLRLARDREVTRIRARVGGHPVDPDLIRQCVQEAVAGTAAEHAVTDLVIDPPAVRCLDCGNEMAVGYALALLACRRCGSLDLEVSGTEDLTLESVTFTE
jgi:hydrogenase nickel incorporation protein HypA/HybF